MQYFFTVREQKIKAGFSLLLETYYREIILFIVGFLLQMRITIVLYFTRRIKILKDCETLNSVTTLEA